MMKLQIPADVDGSLSGSRIYAGSVKVFSIFNLAKYLKETLRFICFDLFSCGSADVSEFRAESI